MPPRRTKPNATRQAPTSTTTTSTTGGTGPWPSNLPAGLIAALTKAGVTPAQYQASGMGAPSGVNLGGLPTVSGVTGAVTGAVGGAVGGALKGFVPYLKVGAGGFIVIVSGLALVYVAGRNTAPVQAAKTAVKVATPGGQAVRSVARKASPKARTSRTKAKTSRNDAKFYKAAYEGTAEAKAGTSAARGAKVLPRLQGVANKAPRKRAA